MIRLDAITDSFDDIYNQLCEFYDICNKYNIDSFEYLEDVIKNGLFINNGTETILGDTIKLTKGKEQTQNQKAIEELTKVQEELYKDKYFYHNIDGEQYDYGKINDFIDQQIKELRGEK